MALNYNWIYSGQSILFDRKKQTDCQSIALL